MELLQNASLLLIVFLLNAVNECKCILKCYSCTVHPPAIFTNETTRLCSQFNQSDHYIVDCPFSTFCINKTFQLTLQQGKTVKMEEKGCAPQKYNYQVYKNGKWSLENSVEEDIYKEGCYNDEQTKLTTTTEYCYCSSNLCNHHESPSSSINHHQSHSYYPLFVIFSIVLVYIF